MRSSAVLVLENGAVFEGEAVGARGIRSGEVCFQTGMTGYQEVLTDPSYCEQIVVMTAAQIGNYGIRKGEGESDRVQVAGMVMRECSRYHPPGTQGLSPYLEQHGVPGMEHTDTRALTRMIRDEGAMRAVLATDGTHPDRLLERVRQHPKMSGRDLTHQVSTTETYWWSRGGTGPGAGLSVIVIDFGVKHNILRCLADTGASVLVMPPSTPAEAILERRAQGVLLSNGPGDPAATRRGVELAGQLLERVPLHGICLGHQLLSLAMGASTYKLPFGHRGIHHPVLNLSTGLVTITSQNHGFAVEEDSLPAGTVATHRHLNDQSLEGIANESLAVCSVQFHPEAAPGPHDARGFFDDFLSAMRTHAPSS